jgi:ABC-2 type transport system ATP-binding protein/nitrous oxidase accessory protein
MITITNLTKRFGAYTAVDNLTFDVAASQAIALWGPNGAGKTTVIKCLLGLLRYEGRIQVGGFDAHKQGQAARALLGYVPQELAFYDDMSTLEMAHYFARLKRASAKRVPEVLEQVGLAEHGGKLVRALSGGMKQRLALGLAMLADPPVLVLDEPTSSLDTAARSQFLSLLTQVKGAGKTIIFTSHRIEEVEALGDQALVMERGRLLQSCPASQLAERVGLRTQVKLMMAPHLLDLALGALQADGFAARRNGTGVLVDVPPREKALPIHTLTRANIPVTDFEME